MGSSSCLALISSISGRSTRIFAEDMKFFQVTGDKASLMINVMIKTMMPTEATRVEIILYSGRITLRLTHPKIHQP